MKAAIYIRVSTPGQAINGESLDMQKLKTGIFIKHMKMAASLVRTPTDLVFRQCCQMFNKTNLMYY